MPINLTTKRDKRYLQLTKEALHIVGRDWCFEWHQGEVDTVIDLWNRNYGLHIIARRVESTPRDTFLLLLELAEQGKIKPRPGFVWGGF